MEKLRCSRRSGFTLVELLVSIGLLLMLAALAAFLVPRMNRDQQSTQAAAQLQQWFEIAKQRAIRDRAPRGVRLLPGTGNAAYVTNLVYLVQADNYYLGSKQVANQLGTGNKTVFSQANVVNYNAQGQATIAFYTYDPTLVQSATNPSTNANNLLRNLTGNAATAALYPVQPGDHLVLDNGSAVFKVNNVTNKNHLVTTATTAQVQQQVPAGYATTNYVFLRQQRPDGDEPLLMPQNIIIDCLQPSQAGYLPAAPPVVSPGLDIMFAPDGRVIGPLSAFDKLIFWVRDVTIAAGNEGDPTLVVIYTQTGLIAAQPVDVSNYNSVTNANPTPYTYTKTGVRSSE